MVLVRVVETEPLVVLHHPAGEVAAVVLVVDCKRGRIYVKCGYSLWRICSQIDGFTKEKLFANNGTK